ncbi:hypothetical protein CFC21_089888 [Triticum aestivum]|uniref:Serine-rich protein-like protein n=3 Tax=Triticum TaxID=4564 RepID=A0A9R0YX25_TRITD|nr:uncharacterized protein LOC119324259 [Triticum dicoccoides]XP_044409967.1 uncharacterized protein LOC123134878 [Triticum aestivum]KAF7086603.1 hypothetical protein CFC21_089888 [Triticum aestivum]VAI62380.1 unnamed protein product [Triticum turgidum subsp. durum]
MSTAAASRPSGPILLSPFPNYQSASLSRVKLSVAGSPVKSFSVSSPPSSPTAAAKIRRSCLCSPTNHPGSFRCSLHKERKQEAPAVNHPVSPPSNSKRTASPFAQLVPSGSGSGCSKRSYNGLAQRVPMGSGHWARKALVPSQAVQQLQHRKRVVERFHAGPSRLSAASMAGRSNQ